MDGPADSGRLPMGDPRSSANPPTPALPSNRSKRRATRACDRCKHKKMRCSGQKPCVHCASAGVHDECSFTAKYTRGKAPAIKVASQISESTWTATPPWTPGVQQKSSKIRQPPSDSSESSSSEHVDPPSQEKGPHTFTAVYRRAQHGLSHGLSKTPRNPVFAHGDPLLPETDLSLCLLPPLDEARRKVAKFFDVVTPNLRVLHQPTVDIWLLDVIQSFRSGHNVDNALSALVLLVLASAYNHTDSESHEDDQNISFRYFQAADDLLKNEKGEVRLESIQARLLQIFFLSSRSRVNHAWSVLGIVVNQIYVIGLHRKSKVDRKAKRNLIREECAKRTFWTVYTVDKHFSLAFGRPEYLKDETIDQELPSLVNDVDLTETSCMESKDDLSCTMISSIYRKQFAQILGAANRDLYGIQPQTFEKRLALARQHHNSIKMLAHANTAFLQQDMTNLPTMIRQQLFGIRLANSYLTIIIFRPFLLHNPSVDDEINPVLREDHESNVLGCIRAAKDMTEHLDFIFKLSPFFNGSWFTYFSGSTAIVALYIYVIKHQSDPEENWMPYFKAAERCQNQIKVAAGKESYSLRSSQILDGLHAEAMSHILRRKRKQERAAIPERPETNEGQDGWFEEPQYTEQFNMPTTDSSSRQPVSEYVYGEEWQNMNFDQTAPGGGILGSMDWIGMEAPSSVVDQIELWGFSSLAGW